MKKNGEQTKEERMISEELKEFYDKLKEDDESVKSVSLIKDFKVDENNKGTFSLGDVYFVTKEIETPDGDKKPIYEIYGKDTKEMIGETDLQNRLHLDKQYDDLIKQYGFDIDKQLVQMIDKDKDGLSTKVAVVNNMKDENGQLKELDSKNKLDNKEEEKVQDEKTKELSEDEIKEKSEEEGKKISTINIIDDPTFYSVTTGATVKSYLVKYQDGTIGCMNGRGEDIFENENREASTDNLRIDDPATKTKEKMIPSAAFKTGTDNLVLAVKDDSLYLIDQGDEHRQSHPIEMAGQVEITNKEKNAMEADVLKDNDYAAEIKQIQKWDNTISDEDAKSIAEYMIGNDIDINGKNIDNTVDNLKDEGIIESGNEREERKPSQPDDE